MYNCVYFFNKKIIIITSFLCVYYDVVWNEFNSNGEYVGMEKIED